MNRLVVYFCFLFLFQNLVAQQIPIGAWKDELPYLNAQSVVQSANKIYCSTPVSLYSVDKSDFSLEKLSKVNRLSDIGFSTLHFDADRNQLIVAYNNSNIDILDSTGTFNISDIKRKNIVGDKTIYQIFQHSDMAFLCCGFGIVALNEVKHEIADTYYPGQTASYNKVNSMTADNDFYYAATASGLYRVAINSANLSDFSQWIKINLITALPDKEVSNIININDVLYCSVKDSLFKFNGTQWNKIFYRNSMHIRSLNNGSGELLICMNSDSINLSPRVIKIFPDNAVDSIPSVFYSPRNVLIDENENYWIADEQSGLKFFSNNQEQTIFPTGPLSQKAADIAVRNGIAYVVPGGVNGENYSGESSGYFISYNGYWINFNKYNAGGVLDSVTDLFKVAANPITGEAYLASYRNGLIKLNADGSFNAFYNLQNSSLQAQSGDPIHPLASGLAVDNDGNLWVSNSNAPNPLSLLTADGTWKSFYPTSPTGGGWLFDIAIDQSNYKWIVLARNNGILVYDSGIDPLSVADDRWKTLTMGIGSGGLPTNTVQCLAADKDGYIWVGTDQGVAVFYCPYSVFDAGGCDAQQIIVKQDLYNGYLLGTESINDIAVDGANRKWFATNNGAFLMSADGTDELFHFTTDNSPLFSNNINCIGIDNNNGDVYFGTDLGIIVYRGDATEGNESGHLSDTAFIFPNPVRPNFTGVVAIKGLAYQSQIKITDITGVLVYETESNGGEAVWNIKDLKGNRVNTGVYLVFATDATGTDKLVGKIAVAK